MVGDKDIQAQDQAHQVQGYCAVVDDNMGGDILAIYDNCLTLPRTLNETYLCMYINELKEH